MTGKQPTKKEIEELKETKRGNAMKNLRESNLSDLATAYFTDSDKNYGEYDNSAVEEFLYFPAFNSKTSYHDLESGEETDLLKSSLLGSRQNGKRYSGQVSEYNMIKNAADVIQGSLGAIKVEDLMSLLGSVFHIKEDYKGKYIGDLIQSEKEEEKEFAMKLVGGYLQYQTAKKVSKALGQRADKIKGGLEELVKKE